MTFNRFSRRLFLGATGALTTVGLGRLARADERPHVGDPRATDGDDVSEPNWKERLTVTVGPDKADLVGKNDKVIQAAVDYVARLGGGTVRILPGTYTLRNSIVLSSGVRIVGSGADSVLTKIPSTTVDLERNSDWYDREVTVADGRSFRVGDGVVLRAKNPHNGSLDVIKRTIVARSGNRLKLDRGLRKNLWLSGKPTCSSLFALLTSERTRDVVIEDLTLDGNLDNNEFLNGNYVGAIFLQDCNRYTIRRVTARHYNGDGISFQICHDVVVEGCHSHDNAGLGLHPGSGSQRPLMHRNRLERNDIGLFWCWGVRYGLAEDNEIRDNRRFGISTGHHDTDNVMRGNTIVGSGQVGILFRAARDNPDFAAHRNTVERNRIINSGGDEGVAIDIQGHTRGTRIVGNTLLEKRTSAKRIGIRIGKHAGSVELADNAINGFSTSVRDLRAT